MKAQELRIGNYIQLDPTRDWVGENHDKPVIVESISSQGVNYSSFLETGVQWDDLEKFVGIPLSEEWLIKFGFEKKKSYTQHGNGQDWQPSLPKTDFQDFVLTSDVFIRYEIFHWVNDQGKEEIDEPYGRLHINDCTIPIPETVHHFQNIVFALTGEELTIKE